jgi:hypothetical protein
MLLKYLNDLEQSVRAAQQRPSPEQLADCLECIRVLREYLDQQVEPLQRRGFELMGELVPSPLMREMEGQPEQALSKLL